MLSTLAAYRPRFRPYRSGDESRLDPPDVERARWMMHWLEPIDRYFDYSVVGLEHIPDSGPALLVSYHTYAVVDVFLLARRIFMRDERVVRGLTDRIIFMIPGLRDLFTTFGTVVGTPDNGLGLLRAGELASCMPGGALEWSRPSTLKRHLRWGDHRGYAKLAMRAGVPVIPTACPAGDDLYYVPYDGWKVGEKLQRLLGAGRNLPAAVAIGIGPLPFRVPLTQHVGEPIHPTAPPEAADDDDAVGELDERVRSSMRELLTRG